MKKIVITFGLISGAIMSALMILATPWEDRVDWGFGEVVGYASMVAASLLIYFGVRRYRDDVAGGSIGFGRALAVGTAIALIAAACYTVTWELIYMKKGDAFNARYLAAEMKKLEARHARPEEMDAKRAELARFAEMYKNPLYNSAVTMLEPLPVSLLVALISAGLLRRRKGEELASELARAV